jgi:hypothetical protein
MTRPPLDEARREVGLGIGEQLGDGRDPLEGGDDPAALIAGRSIVGLFKHGIVVATKGSWCWDAEAPVRGLQRGLWVTTQEQSDRRHPVAQELA